MINEILTVLFFNGVYPPISYRSDKVEVNYKRSLRNNELKGFLIDVDWVNLGCYNAFFN